MSKSPDVNNLAPGNLLRHKTPFSKDKLKKEQDFVENHKLALHGAPTRKDSQMEKTHTTTTTSTSRQKQKLDPFNPGI